MRRIQTAPTKIWRRNSANLKKYFLLFRPVCCLLVAAFSFLDVSMKLKFSFTCSTKCLNKVKLEAIFPQKCLESSGKAFQFIRVTVKIKVNLFKTKMKSFFSLSSSARGHCYFSVQRLSST